jgi:hypothetical protein
MIVFGPEPSFFGDSDLELRYFEFLILLYALKLSHKFQIFNKNNFVSYQFSKKVAKVSAVEQKLKLSSDL